MVKRLGLGAALAALVVFFAAGHGEAQQPACQDCHSDSSFATQDSTGAARSLFVTDASLQNSVHAGLGCADCHAGITEIPHPEKLPRAACATCHQDAQAACDAGIHHQAASEDAPTCGDCHGSHDIRAVADTASTVNPRHQAFTCARCHSNPRLVEKYDIPIRDPLAAYRNSVHGWLTLTEGKMAATCSSCHGGHKILPATDPNSSISRINTPKTCGQCHGEITDQYVQSVHGTAMARGVSDSPDCNDCHGEHNIERARAATSPTAPQNLATQTCGRCHASARLVQKYGLAGNRVSSFTSSYHGLALRGGNRAVANCASCHGVHEILPSSDPRSMIAPANLEKTCGKCHKDVTANYARGKVHETGEDPPALVNNMVRNIYIGLIVLVIGGMVLHNGLDFIRKSRQLLRQR